MFNRYFQQELANLKDLGGEFAKAHPALAPMLSGSSADPDVERLLEGVAFLTALLRQKLDDEFPEVIHELMQILWPHYLRPIPSSTLVAFQPKPTFKQSLVISPGIHIASIPVEGTPCQFRTCYEVEIHPLQLLDASLSQPAGRAAAIQLVFELNGIKTSDWRPKGLRFCLSGDYPTATDLYFLLRNHLKSIQIRPRDKGNPVFLPPECLKPVGFSAREALLPYPSHSFPGYRILQEYFHLPEKFLFLELTGWERWQERGEGSRFEVLFELEEIPFPPPRFRKENFVLFATPAVNIFPHEADPILLDHRKTQYLVRPSGANVAHYQVYSVEKVTGFVRGTAEERAYVPFELFNSAPQTHPVYHLAFRGSPLTQGYDVFLSVAYPPEAGPPAAETLSTQILCTNGSLPENLRVGDLAFPTSDSPEFVEFRNIRPPTASVLPPLGTNLLWRFLSHLSLNYLSLAKTENLKALLQLYIFPESRDRAAILANAKRVGGIEGIEARPSNRLVSGFLMRGQEIQARLRQENFAGPGDMYLFGCILDHFLGGYASINSFTQFVVQEVQKGDQYRWPARVGDRPLI
jgi:type VI secretion system protein ImpG